MREFLLFLMFCLLATLTACGGGDDNPAGPTSIVGSYYVAGAYFYFPVPSRSGMTNGAAIIVRDGSQSGPVVSDASVTVNDQQLQYDASQGLYSGTTTSLVSGENVSFKVSDGLGSVSCNVQIPFPPSNLRLSNYGTWDLSSSLASNSLIWDNPIVVGEAVAVGIYAWENSDADLLFEGQLAANAVEATIYNSQLAYVNTLLDSVVCMVGQANGATLPNNPTGSGVSVITATWGIWPTYVGP